MKVSAVIPTLGRSKEVLDTVQALLKQTRVPDEIIVADQNQPPLAELDQGLAGLPKVRQSRNPVPGYVSNCNWCLKESTGDIIIFLDDDVTMTPTLIENYLKTLEKQTSPVAGIAGRVEQPEGDLQPEKIRDFGRYFPWSGKVVANFNSTRGGYVDIAQGANMLFYRKLLVSAGGFDRGFDGNGYFSETDLALRIKKLGYRIVFEPLASLKHLRAPMGGCRILDKATHTYYFIKNGVRLHRRHSPSLALPWLILKSAGYVFAKAAYNLDIRILVHGLRAILDGLTQSMEIAQQ